MTTSKPRMSRKERIKEKARWRIWALFGCIKHTLQRQINSGLEKDEEIHCDCNAVLYHLPLVKDCELAEISIQEAMFMLAVDLRELPNVWIYSDMTNKGLRYTIHTQSL